MNTQLSAESPVESIAWMTYDVLICIYSLAMTLVLVVVSIKFKVYKNYSSTLMVSILQFLQVDMFVMATLRMRGTWHTDTDTQFARFVNEVFTTFVFSCISGLLLLQWLQAYQLLKNPD